MALCFKMQTSAFISAHATLLVFLLRLMRVFVGAGCISPAPVPTTAHLCLWRDPLHVDVEVQKHQLQ